MTIYEDLEPRKQEIIDYIKVIYEVTDESFRSHSAKPPTVDEWVELRRLCSFLKEDEDKLQTLIKSQLMSGNVRGAIKLIKICQGQKFNSWGYLLVSPITVPFSILIGIIWAPIALFKWVARNA